MTIKDVIEDYDESLQSLRNKFLELKSARSDNNMAFFNFCLKGIADADVQNRPLMEYLKQLQHKALCDIMNKDFIVSIGSNHYNILYDSALVDFSIILDLYKNRHKKIFLFVLVVRMFTIFYPQSES